MDSRMENNWVRLQGSVLTEPLFSHKSYGEAFYRFILGAARKSGYIDR
ncbi:MAG: single-stranded DNA-binding protein, partial [Clostridiales bacterium]|nr:single-stranded DNA-binding protein [Clostridiales bacterium]